VERVETEWRKPLDKLLADAPELAGDLECCGRRTTGCVAPSTPLDR